MSFGEIIDSDVTELLARPLIVDMERGIRERRSQAPPEQDESADDQKDDKKPAEKDKDKHTEAFESPVPRSRDLGPVLRTMRIVGVRRKSRTS